MITWIVNTKHMLCNIEISNIFCLFWSDIIVKMSSITMLTVAVKVLHSQIQALQNSSTLLRHNKHNIITSQ